jgi:hypothetical protein
MGELFPVLTRIYEFIISFLPHYVIISTVQAGMKWRYGCDEIPLFHNNGMIILSFKYPYYRRTGIHWYWPWTTEEPTVIPVKRQTSYLPKQNIDTKDGKTVHLRGIFIYEVEDVQLLLTMCHGYDDTCHDFALAAIHQFVSEHTYEELVADRKSVVKKLSARLRNELKHFGMRTIRLSLADFATGMGLIHMTDMLDNHAQAEEE